MSIENPDEPLTAQLERLRKRVEAWTPEEEAEWDEAFGIALYERANPGRLSPLRRKTNANR